MTTRTGVTIIYHLSTRPDPSRRLRTGAVVGRAARQCRADIRRDGIGRRLADLKPLPSQWFTDFGTNAEMRWDSVPRSGLLHPQPPTVRPRPHEHAADRSAQLPARACSAMACVAARRPTTRSASPTGSSSGWSRSTIISFVECTGNGRSFFGSQQGQTVSGTAWTLGAIGVTRWRGVPLSALLDRAGLRRSAVDVMAAGSGRPVRLRRRRLRPGTPARSRSARRSTTRSSPWR